jgi:hypothetical protein
MSPSSNALSASISLSFAPAMCRDPLLRDRGYSSSSACGAGEATL